LAELVKPLVEEKLKQSIISNLPSQIFLEGFCRLIKEKAHFVNEFWDLGSYFFTTPATYDAEVLKKRLNEQSLNFIEQLKADLNSVNDFKAAQIEATFKATAEKMAIPTGQVMQLFRVAITGVGGGPVLFEMMELFGKENSLKRLDLAIAAFKL